jgi:hypothetical protein
MIPQHSTPVKNAILTEIFAKGKLSHTEMRIVSYIIRWSWGFASEKGRQEWTKPLTITQIAKDIKLSRPKCSTAVNRMVKEKKLFRKGSQYQFNEHYDEWVLPNRNMLQKGNSVTKTEHPEVAQSLNKVVKPGEERGVQAKVLPNRNMLQNGNSECYQNGTVVLPNRNTQGQNKQGRNSPARTPKETIKETIKETTTYAPDEKAKVNGRTLKSENGTLRAEAKTAKITFNPVSGRFAHLDEEFLERLRKAFPRANVEAEVKKAELWLYANSAKRKKNYERFLINWMSRAENQRAENLNGGSLNANTERKGGSSGKNGRYVPVTKKNYPDSREPLVSRAGEW